MLFDGRGYFVKQGLNSHDKGDNLNNLKPFFQFDSDEARQSLLSRARNVALWAIQQYDLDWNRIRFIQLSGTITYKIETDTKGSYLLRMHPERQTKAEIESELYFLKELSESKFKDDLIAPEAVASRDGSLILEAATEKDYRSPYVTMMRWVEGEHLREFTEQHVFSMGAMIAKLQNLAARIAVPSTFVRPYWGVASFRQEVAKLERFYTRFLSESSWELYQKAIEKIIQQVSCMTPDEQNYGLIHADVHSGNLVFHNDIPYPIDFGRLSYGYYLYDVAGALLELNPVLRKWYLDGYASIKRWDPDFQHDLECFFIMFMIENYCHHSSDTREIPGLIQEQKYALAYIKEFLEDRSFLFEPIKPVEVDVLP